MPKMTIDPLAVSTSHNEENGSICLAPEGGDVAVCDQTQPNQDKTRTQISPSIAELMAMVEESRRDRCRLERRLQEQADEMANIARQFNTNTAQKKFRQMRQNAQSELTRAKRAETKLLPIVTPRKKASVTKQTSPMLPAGCELQAVGRQDPVLTPTFHASRTGANGAAAANNDNVKIQCSPPPGGPSDSMTMVTPGQKQPNVCTGKLINNGPTAVVVTYPMVGKRGILDGGDSDTTCFLDKPRDVLQQNNSNKRDTLVTVVGKDDVCEDADREEIGTNRRIAVASEGGGHGLAKPSHERKCSATEDNSQGEPTEQSRCAYR